MLWLDYYWHKVLRRPYTLAKRIDKGRGQPVVFLHGIAATGENWRYVSDLLDEKRYRTIAFDLLGFGESPQPDWLEYSVDDHAKAVLATLKRMRIHQPVILIGHSMGSLVAAHIARKYPRRVKHLILYQMPIYSAIPNLDVKDFRRQAYLSAFRYFAEHPKATLWYAKVLGRTASKVAGFVLDERTWQPFELSLRNTIMQQQSMEDLRTLKMPTDVIYGRYDVLVLKKNLQHFFHPSKYLRFYEINEIHRISMRAGQLIYELVTQDPKKREPVTVKHARLVEMMDIHKLSEKKYSEQKLDRKLYGMFGLMALLIFTISTIIASKGTVTGWERSLFDAINGWQAPGFVTTVAKIASDLVWVAVFVVALLFLFKKYFWAAWRVAVPAVATYVTVFIVEHVVGRARPEALLPTTDVVLRATQDGMGYPSGHMAVITAIVFTLWPFMSWPLRIAGIALMILVGWSRVYLGVHFPLDIIGGFAAGVGVVCVLHLLPSTLRKKLRLA